MNTKEVAEFLDINEKQVYALIKTGSIPCTRATGKWLFPRKLIVEWLENEASRKPVTSRPGNGTILAAGSNDPILEILLHRLMGKNSGHLFTCNTGSTRGLELLGSGSCDIAFSHLGDPLSVSDLRETLYRYLPGCKATVVHLFRRDLGLIHDGTVTDSPENFFGLTGKNRRFINRQPGSGTRIFTDQILDKAGILPATISGYEREVLTHFEIALAVKTGSANAGIGSVSAAKIFGLPFLPLKSESFDMVLKQDTFFRSEIQEFIDMLSSGEFRKTVTGLGDYDFTTSGRILLSLS